MLTLIKITVTKTSDGMNEYVQLMSADQLSLNVIAIAQKIEILDAREIKPAPRRDLVQKGVGRNPPPTTRPPLMKGKK